MENTYTAEELYAVQLPLWTEEDLAAETAKAEQRLAEARAEEDRCAADRRAVVEHLIRGGEISDGHVDRVVEAHGKATRAVTEAMAWSTALAAEAIRRREGWEV